MSDLIDRQAAIDAFWKLDIKIRPSAIDAIINMLNTLPSAQPELTENDWKLIRQMRSNYNGTYAKVIDRLIAPAQPERTEIIRCKDCNKASKCYGDVIMRSRGGGNIYCPLEFCSEAERRIDE